MNLSYITVTAKQISDLSDVEQQLLTRSYYYDSGHTHPTVSIITGGGDFFILYKNTYPVMDVSYSGVGNGVKINLIYYTLGFDVSSRRAYALIKTFYHLGVES